MIDLIELWKIYNEDRDFKKCLQLSLENLCANAGIDFIHIAGLALMNLKRQNEGLALLKAAIIFRPESVHIYINAAYLLEQSEMHNDVTFFVDAGLVDFPSNPDLLLLKANNLASKLEFDEAKKFYLSVLSITPNNFQAMINLGNIARSKDDFKEAERFFKMAEKHNAPKMQLIFARATMYTQMGYGEKSRALLEPVADDVDAKFLLSLIDLADGNYERGFKLYSNRCDATWYKYGNFVHPLRPFDHWSEAKDKDIAILQEGGLGDMIQFMRYIPMLAEIAKSVTIFVPSVLSKLFLYNLLSNVIIKEHIKHIDLKDDTYDYVTTDEEMPYHFRTTIDTVPNKNPYIIIPQEEIDKHLLPAFDGKKIGLCWAGGKRDGLNQRSYDERRSISFELLKPLLDIPNLQFYSLQLEEDVGLPGIKKDFDFADTAAIIAQLDLVISVDTSVVHLAAAMGKETWLLSRYDCCWRWNHNQSSPWYPNVTIFGQKNYKDWSVPLKELEIKLREFAES